MIRRACVSDSLAWYQLRNDPEMRFWSESSREVQAIEHMLWFSNVLSNPRHALLVDEGEQGDLRGWARAELKTVAVVSVVVQQEHRGQGIGTALLRELERTIREMPATMLQAVVHPSNIASIRSFFKAGYVPNRGREGFVILERSIVPNA